MGWGQISRQPKSYGLAPQPWLWQSGKRSILRKFDSFEQRPKDSDWRIDRRFLDPLYRTNDGDSPKHPCALMPSVGSTCEKIMDATMRTVPWKDI